MGERAVSDIVGFILVFSLVASTVAIVSVTGLGTLEEARYNEQVNNAERAYDVLADNLRDVYQEGAPSRATEISLEDAQIDTFSVSYINVSARSGSGTNFSINASSRVIRWESQRNEDTTLDYSLGATVRGQRDGEIMVERPPFVFDTRRTYIPIVRTTTPTPKDFSGSTVRVRGVSRTPTVYWSGDASMFSEVWVNVTTQNPDAWERYLSSREEASCPDEAPARPNKITCKLENRERLYVAIYPVSVEIER